MDDREAYEFYKKPEHLRVVGPGRRRKADMLTEIKSVRLSARMLAGAEAAAEADGRDASSPYSATRPRRPAGNARAYRMEPLTRPSSPSS